MFANAKEIVDYLNNKVFPTDRTAKAYVAGANANDVVMEFYYIGGKTLTLPADEQTGTDATTGNPIYTAVTIPADVKFLTPKCQHVNVVQSGHAIL